MVHLVTYASVAYPVPYCGDCLPLSKSICTSLPRSTIVYSSGSRETIIKISSPIPRSSFSVRLTARTAKHH